MLPICMQYQFLLINPVLSKQKDCILMGSYYSGGYVTVGRKTQVFLVLVLNDKMLREVLVSPQAPPGIGRADNFNL